MSKFNSLKCILFIAVSIIIVGCSDSSPPLRIGTNVWPGYEPLYLARHNGYWTDDEIRLVEYSNASDVLRAFRNNAIEAACLTLDEAILLRQYKIPIKAILVTDISHGGDVILARKPYKSIKDINNKRIGVESSALGAFFLSRALENNSMTVDDIEIKHIPVDHHLSAYKNNQIDAVVTFEPVKTQILSLGANEIFSSKDIPGEIVDVIVVHEKDFINSASKIEKLIKGWFESLEYMKSNEDFAYSVISQRLRISPEEARESYSGIKLPDRQENIKLLGQSNESLRNTISRIKNVLVKKSLLKEQTNIDDLITNTLVDH